MILFDVICIKTTSALPLRPTPASAQVGSKTFKGKKALHLYIKRAPGPYFFFLICMNVWSFASTIFTSMTFPYFLWPSCRILQVSLNDKTHLNTLHPAVALPTPDPGWPSACWGSSWHNAVPFLCASPASHGQMSPCPGFSTSQTAPGQQCSEQTKQKVLVDFCENGTVRELFIF